jgi:hypothetical protein
MAVVCAAGMVWTVPAAAAAAAPQAELSIGLAPSQLSVTFVASSAGFPAQIVSYVFRFGDGHTVTTQSPTVVHIYQAAGRFAPQVTETDALGDTATAAGTLEVDTCAAAASCTKTLQNVGSVEELSATGPTQESTPAGVDLFVGPYQIKNCDPAVETDGAVSDSGFTGNLTVTVVYTVPPGASGKTTCFASVVPFKDTAGKMVTHGKLPMCSGSPPTPPCVMSISPSNPAPGMVATKKLLIPPGDPKVGSL